jgi:hypothetical protein
VAEAECGRFFLTTHRPTERDLADDNLKKSFYDRLFREGELLWERKAGLLPILQPHIRLYYLPPDGVRDRGPT